MKEIPIGVKCIHSLVDRFPNQRLRFKRDVWYRSSVFFLTFVAYTCYHASRKPLSVVKTYFSRSCESLVPPTDIIIDDSNRNTWCDWYPFYGPRGSTLLGTLDSAFLFAYAIAMFWSGFVAERVSLRYFLSLGMIVSGLSCYLMGIAHSYNIHSIWYFIIIQIFGGVIQTTGWPGVVAVMGNWYGKGKRGIIFGLWNSHTSVGNILGGVLASYFLELDWGLSFMVPGIVVSLAGFLIFLFLIESPSDVGIPSPNSHQNSPLLIQNDGDPLDVPVNSQDDAEESDTNLLIPRTEVIQSEEKAIGFFGALKIPGVLEFSLCLFFAKLVSYTLINWLPSYINSSTTLSGQLSAYVSTIFDVGGIFGGIAAGAVSDYSGMNASTCSFMLLLSMPLLFFYNLYGHIVWVNILMLILLGFCVNGPYALITTAVSAELGTHKSLSSNSKALATVTAIIDGTGSIGAALGPLLAGIFRNFGWRTVFYMLIFSDIVALLMLLRLVSQEYQQLRESFRRR